MKIKLPLYLCLIFLGAYTFSKAQPSLSQPTSQEWVQIDANLYQWTDVINVYVIKDGNKGLLIDLGDGSVLDHLQEIGIAEVEWVLFTHHHREQSQGYPQLKRWNAKIAAPEKERLLFEQPTTFRKMNPYNGDEYTVHGASYVRPAIQPIKIDRGILSMDIFNWHGYEIRCLDTPGNSPGAVSYFLKKDQGWIVFSGDVMMDDARIASWYDAEWDYGFAAGFYKLHNSAAAIQGFEPALLLPSHGEVIKNATFQLEKYQEKLRHLIDDLLRDYGVYTYATAIKDKISKPTAVPFVWQVSPHLYKVRDHTNMLPNFSIIMADNGHAMAVDCGLMDEAMLNRTLDLMEERLGLKQIDAVMISHMHGDHFLNIPVLQERYGTEVWALDRMVPQIENPLAYDYAALIPGYNVAFESLSIDWAFKAGEKIHWNDFEFTMDWMPGQTEFAMCLNGEIDGKLVAFTGDNIFADAGDSSHTGHECVVAHNSAILEEGYIYGAEYLKKLDPDLIMGGHSFVMDKPAALIERYRQWAYRMRDALKELSSHELYEYWFDPYWVKAEPYRSSLTPGTTREINIVVRNFKDSQQQHRIEIHTPPGIIASPSVLEGSVDKLQTKTIPVKLKADETATTGVNIMAFDIMLDGHRFGELFDAMIEIKP